MLPQIFKNLMCCPVKKTIFSKNYVYHLQAITKTKTIYLLLNSPQNRKKMFNQIILRKYVD